MDDELPLRVVSNASPAVDLEGLHSAYDLHLKTICDMTFSDTAVVEDEEKRADFLSVTEMLRRAQRMPELYSQAICFLHVGQALFAIVKGASPQAFLRKGLLVQRFRFGFREALQGSVEDLAKLMADLEKHASRHDPAMGAEAVGRGSLLEDLVSFASTLLSQPEVGARTIQTAKGKQISPCECALNVTFELFDALMELHEPEAPLWKRLGPLNSSPFFQLATLHRNALVSSGVFPLLIHAAAAYPTPSIALSVGRATMKLIEGNLSGPSVVQKDAILRRMLAGLEAGVLPMLVSNLKALGRHQIEGEGASETLADAACGITQMALMQLLGLNPFVALVEGDGADAASGHRDRADAAIACQLDGMVAAGAMDLVATALKRHLAPAATDELVTAQRVIGLIFTASLLQVCIVSPHEPTQAARLRAAHEAGVLEPLIATLHTPNRGGSFTAGSFVASRHWLAAELLRACLASFAANLGHAQLLQAGASPAWLDAPPTREYSSGLGGMRSLLLKANKMT